MRWSQWEVVLFTVHLPERQSNRKIHKGNRWTEKEIFHLQFHSPSVCNSPVPDRLKAGVRNSILVSRLVAEVKVLWSFSIAFPGTVFENRSTKQSQNKSDSTIGSWSPKSKLAYWAAMAPRPLPQEVSRSFCERTEYLNWIQLLLLLLGLPYDCPHVMLLNLQIRSYNKSPSLLCSLCISS